MINYISITYTYTSITFYTFIPSSTFLFTIKLFKQFEKNYLKSQILA